MKSVTIIKKNRFGFICTMSVLMVVLVLVGYLVFKNYWCTNNEEYDVFSEEINSFVDYCNDACVGEASLVSIAENGHFARVSIEGDFAEEDAYENISIICAYFQEHIDDSPLEGDYSINVSMASSGGSHDELLIIGFYIELPRGIVTAVDMETNSFPSQMDNYDLFSEVRLVGVWSHVELTNEEARQLEIMYPNADIVVH